MMLHWIRTVTLAVLAVALMTGCDSADVPTEIDYDAIASIGFSEHVQPLLAEKCATAGCHSSADRAAGLALATWEEIISGSDRGECLIPRRPNGSLLTMLFDGTPLRKAHPPIASDPTAAQVRFLRRWIEQGARNDAGSVPFEHSTGRVYVPNQGEDNVSIIDRERLVVMKVVPVGNSPLVEGPHYVTADANYWYVSLINAGQVWKFDAHADTLVAKATIPGAPALLALTPDGGKLYVSQFMSVSTNRVSVVNTATMTVVKEIATWSMPHGLRMNRAGTRAYVANMMSDNVSVIDVAADSVVATVPLAWDVNPTGAAKYMPMEVAVSPDDAMVAVACSETKEVRLISAATNTVTDSIDVGDQPWHLQYTPDNTYCLVTNRRGNSVSGIHLAMGHQMVLYTTPGAPGGFDLPHGCDVSPDGRYTFVSSENDGHSFIPRYNPNFVGNVAVIDNNLQAIVKILEVGKKPTGLSVSP